MASLPDLQPGSSTHSVGTNEGDIEGMLVIVGTIVGKEDGWSEGVLVGTSDGLLEGSDEGRSLGTQEGNEDGSTEG